jgi:hypothetical protein
MKSPATLPRALKPETVIQTVTVFVGSKLSPKGLCALKSGLSSLWHYGEMLEL